VGVARLADNNVGRGNPNARVGNEPVNGAPICGDVAVLLLPFVSGAALLPVVVRGVTVDGGTGDGGAEPFTEGLPFTFVATTGGVVVVMEGEEAITAADDEDETTDEASPFTPDDTDDWVDADDDDDDELVLLASLTTIAADVGIGDGGVDVLAAAGVVDAAVTDVDIIVTRFPHL
jgi:hypothetical protein